MLPLTQEESELVAEVTHPGGMLSTETAHLILNAEVSHANLQRLQTRATLKDIDKYLDDEIVNRYLNHCLTREDENISSNLSGRKRSHFFSSFFVQRMFDEKNSDPNLRGQWAVQLYECKELVEEGAWERYLQHEVHLCTNP